MSCSRTQLGAPVGFEPTPWDYITFSCLAQLRLKFILLIIVKMPTIVGSLTFTCISRITGFGNLNLNFQPILAISVIMSTLNFMLSRVKLEEVL